MFKKWKEKVRSELKKEIDDFKDLAVKMYHKEIDTVGKNISGDHVCLSAGYWKELNYIEIERLKKALEALDE